MDLLISGSMVAALAPGLIVKKGPACDSVGWAEGGGDPGLAWVPRCFRLLTIELELV
jgi:hypothetical protein